VTKKRTSRETLPLFPEDEPRRTPEASPGAGPQSGTEYPARNRDRLQRWAERGIFFGTSSWKYPGWNGLVYNRKYPSHKEFERECLREYAELFPTVCADFALYNFPDPAQMGSLRDQTPEGFRVALKVTDRITVRRYPDLPRHGKNAGKENPDFLNRDLFVEAFLGPVRSLGSRQGVIIFEFSTFFPSSGLDRERFVERIERFLEELPAGNSYAVEIRNSEFLTADYLAMLARHGVAHVLNSWTRMPPVVEQLKVAGIFTAQFSTVRALLRPGRTYQQAVEMFQPYREIREENPELRIGLVEAVQRCIADGRQLYVYVNNRAEGNSPKTIEGILDALDRYPAEKL
jgi:uncharacterized protein YecE (DUF72 family)